MDAICQARFYHFDVEAITQHGDEAMFYGRAHDANAGSIFVLRAQAPIVLRSEVTSAVAVGDLFLYTDSLGAHFFDGVSDFDVTNDIVPMHGMVGDHTLWDARATFAVDLVDGVPTLRSVPLRTTHDSEIRSFRTPAELQERVKHRSGEFVVDMAFAVLPIPERGYHAFLTPAYVARFRLEGDALEVVWKVESPPVLDVAATHDGVYVATTENTFRINRKGRIVFTRDERATVIEETRDGGAIAIGDHSLWKMDERGTTAWTTELGPILGSAMLVTDDGTVVVAYRTSPNFEDARIETFDAATGAPRCPAVAPVR